MRLRSSLLLLSFATAAPLLALSVLAGAHVFQRENDNVFNAALARNRATLEAVDAELRGTMDTLRALSSSPSLARTDLVAFQGEANQVLSMQPHWRNVVVSDPAGRQLVNARRAGGTTSPEPDPAPRSLEAAVSSRMPIVGDVSFAPLFQNEPGVRVRLPIERNGKVALVLTAVVKPEVFQQMLTNQQLPEGWVSGLVGTDGRIIARVPPVPPGSFASADYRDRVARSGEGWYRGNTIEGRDTYTAFAKSKMTGWSIGYAIPAEAIVGGARGASTLIAGGILLSLASALFIGYWVSRRIAAPISELVGAASSLGSEHRAVHVGSSIHEVMQLARALGDASDAIKARDDELRRTTEELRVQAGELGKSNVNKTRFLALLSHELRNPLAPLRNGVALLKSTRDPRVQADTVSMMERQLRHITRLIEDLLDIGRIDRGQIALEMEALLLESVVQTAIESTKPGMEGKGQSLIVRYSPMRTYVQGDPVRLTQVFMNLLGNASKYTPPGGRIEVHMGEEGEHAIVAVSDTGVGFSASESERIFDMFVRLDRPKGEADPGGLGIGLTLTRSLVELHHGRIEGASKGAGRGAVFTVSLPMCSPLVAPAEADPSSPGIPVKTGRVLIADDNVDAAQTFAELLRMQGFEVREAYDGAEALRSAHEFHPHVVFLDLDMPRMTGIEVAMQLRQLATPVRPLMVALTGWGQESDLVAARAAGFDEHLTKPADPAAVMRMVAQAMEKTSPARA